MQVAGRRAFLMRMNDFRPPPGTTVMAGNVASSLGTKLQSLESRSLPSAGVTANLSVFGVLRITGTAAADDITVRQADGSIWIDDTDIIYGSTPYETVPTESIRRIAINSFAGDDIVFLSAAGQEVAVPTVVNAGMGDDWVYTGSGNDTVNGGYGNDLLFASDGIDALYGQPGNDFLDDGNRAASELAVGGVGFDWNADVVAVQGTGPADIKQRGSPTCSFLASLSGLAGQGYDFRQWISYDGVNDVGVPVYSVAFWNATDWTWQSVEFDGTLFGTDTAPAAEGESWVVVMNRAWAAFRGDDGTAFPHEALLALTGQEANHAEYWDAMMGGAELDVIRQTLDQGGLIIAGTGPDEYLGTLILVPNHAYTVLQIFEWDGEIWMQMRNPMGVDGGAITSGNTRDGIVYVTWDEFRQSMTYLAAF
jgi:Calpain family cysteine protease/RTX calcium-binding nonapeptide repeat (4 copies)